MALSLPFLFSKAIVYSDSKGQKILQISRDRIGHEFFLNTLRQTIGKGRMQRDIIPLFQPQCETQWNTPQQCGNPGEGKDVLLRHPYHQLDDQTLSTS